MSLIETEETNRFSFASFAAHPFYICINRLLVHQALSSTRRPAGARFTIVDMACGTGAITQLIAEEIALQGRQARIIGIDPSAEALRLAQRKMEGMGAIAEFIPGEADDLPHLVHHADAAFFCNAMHLLADKLVVFRHMAALLAPGGILACNSAFYEGANIEETVRFSRLWIRRAVGWLRKEHPEVHLSREAKATAMQWLTPEAYVSLLKQSGFSRVDVSDEGIVELAKG